MPVYQYKALIKGSGKPTRGVIDADSPALARMKLRELDLYPTELKEATDGSSLKEGEGKGKSRFFPFGGGVSTRDVALMTRQFAVLLRAGMPLVEALNALITQTSRQRLKTAILDVRDKVNAGKNLADALSEHPRIFSSLYVNMVRAGEASGTLEQVLNRLADVLDRQAKIKAQILSSIAYPAFMTVFAISVITFMMTVIVPRITTIFKKQQSELPFITDVLIGVSSFLGRYGIFFVGFLFLLIILWRIWISREEGRKKWDRWKFKIPLYGTLLQKLLCARFSRTLGTMLQSGLTMLPALDVVYSIMDNRFIQMHLDDIKAGVRRGRDLAQPMKDSGIFPPMMIHMVELGQRSGELENMLIQIADTYDEDVRLTVDAIVGLIEPVIIVVMGIFVGFLVLAILLPILKMSTHVGG
ncbi:MAG TPA: type II secretion system inner membrane protein GspF [Candidatus Hydrogenedens sp.]|nr:type II secretion system inner membrane protein GspF [Candidatus Hydrogenedens sp.]